jgi:hypothetical protein
MAGVTQQSPLFAREMGKLAAAVNSTKGTEPIIGNMGLPAGIENGVAQLRNAYLSVYKEGDYKGQPFFRADARCVSPEEYKGGVTQYGPLPLCDTPKANKKKTFNDHWADFRSTVVTLLGEGGIQTFDGLGDGLVLDTPQGQTQYEARLKGLLETITKAKPFFHFRTWKGKKALVGPYAGKEPQVQHVWGETCEWNAQVDPGAGVTYTEPSTNGTHVEPDNSPDASADGLPVGDDVQPADEQQLDEAPTQDDTGGIDMDDLLRRCNLNDTEAQSEMQQIAYNAGASEADVEGTQTWEELVTLIEQSSAQPEPEEEPAPKVPAKGDMYRYTVIDAKTGKPALDKFKKPRKPVVCDVTAVDLKTSTVTLLNVDDKKTTYKSVPFASLESAT